MYPSDWMVKNLIHSPDIARSNVSGGNFSLGTGFFSLEKSLMPMFTTFVLWKTKFCLWIILYDHIDHIDCKYGLSDKLNVDY